MSLLLLFGNSISSFDQDGVTYLLRDKFSTDVTPLVDGNASEGGGIGYRDVTGTGFYAENGRLRGGHTSSGKITYKKSSGGAGWDRVGGRTFTLLVTPDDSETDISIWLDETAGAFDGYGISIHSRKFYITEPGETEFEITFGSGGIDDPQRTIPYLLGITLNEDRGAIYWVSNQREYIPNDGWPIAAYPVARILFISTLGTFSTVYPTIYADSGFSYPGGIAVEDVRLLDIYAWAGPDGMAVYSDRFARADDSGSLNGSWYAEGSSTWGISSEQAYNPVSAFNGRAYVTGYGQNVLVVADITSGSDLSGWFGLLLRRSVVGTWMRLYNNGGANVYLQKYLSGAWDGEVFSTYAAFATNQTKRWFVGAVENSFRLHINGGETIQQPTIDTDGNHSDGQGFGLFGDSDYGQRWDNFAIYHYNIDLISLDFRKGAYPVAPTVEEDLLIEDLFDDTNGTGLDVHNPAWTEDSGTWVIQSNTLQVSGAGSDFLAYLDAGYANVKISIEIRADSVIDQLRSGLILRYVDSNNYVIVRLFTDEGTQPGSHEIEVVEIIGGSSAVVKKAYLGDYFAASAVHSLDVEVVSDILHVYLDGDQRLTIYLSDPALLTGTFFGLSQDLGSDPATFNNFFLSRAEYFLIANGEGPLDASGAAELIGETESIIEATGEGPLDASGTATLTHYILATGEAPLSQNGSGTLVHVIVTTGEKPFDASGTATLQHRFAASGNGPVDASGAALLNYTLIAAGNAPIDAGGAAITLRQIPAAGENPIDASGSALLAYTMFATGNVPIDASGSSMFLGQIPAWGAPPIDASGSATLAYTLAATGEKPIDASGSAALQHIILCTGEAPIDASGMAEFVPALVATGEKPIDASGTATTQHIILASGTLPIDASGAASLVRVMVGAGEGPIDASGSARLDYVILAAGNTPADASGSATLQHIILAAGESIIDYGGSATLVRGIVAIGEPPLDASGSALYVAAMPTVGEPPLDASGMAMLAYEMRMTGEPPIDASGSAVFLRSMLAAGEGPVQAGGNATLAYTLLAAGADPIDRSGSATLQYIILANGEEPIDASGAAEFVSAIVATGERPLDASGSSLLSYTITALGEPPIDRAGSHSLVGILTGVGERPIDSSGIALLEGYIIASGGRPIDSSGSAILWATILASGGLPSDAGGTAVTQHIILASGEGPVDWSGDAELVGLVTPTDYIIAEGEGPIDFAGEHDLHRYGLSNDVMSYFSPGRELKLVQNGDGTFSIGVVEIVLLGGS